ncbi:MAG TPA: STAS/SEC14 domain-containing protein [Bacillota bacterium]|nr:STAS/SEC14 domain-containing protein [Bacillota bacterium]
MDAEQDHGFKVEAHGSYIHLETWGALDEGDLDAPAKAALALRDKTGIEMLLDNIQRVDASHININVQAKGVGVLWSLRKFKKVAIVFKGDEMGWMFLSTLEAMHLNLNNKFKGFSNETEAIAWLQEEANPS